MQGGGAPRVMTVASLVMAMALAVGRPGGAAAEPGDALGGGVYEVVGGVYGTAEDGLIGGTTASGHVLRADDRLVGLPACTASSCPWLPPGTGTGGEWGPQTSCAEGDGLCWVELTSPETGACVAAPVLDLGPFFLRDNWWAPIEQRSYGLAQGVPAARPAAEGADLGFGPGVSDDGSDVAAVGQPLALAVAAGSWADLGLAPGAGAAPLRVRLLWQAGLVHGEACGGGTGAPVENATARQDLALRAGPSFGDEVLWAVPGGRRVAVTGEPRDGFYPVTHGGRAGWAAGDALLFDTGDPTALLYATAVVNLRAEPSLEAEVLLELPAGAEAARLGAAVDGFVPVAYGGVVGWVAAAYLR